MSSVVKLGTWGGDGGSACDITVAPQRLESITIRWGKVLDSIAFTYRDREGQLHTAGPWGGNGGEKADPDTITLGPSEYVTEVAWSVGPFKLKNVDRCISSIKFVTNHATYGPFGYGVDSTHHSMPVLNNGSIVGMFARAGDYLDAIGFYVLPF
ncbi:protein GOS9-like [Phragmites australis]|uniref:protein GOS9-like n=1 Tax=Phragmites australis TaxID=29695 RepID=UPI002D784996|nr:protein GOS9-like [Phragmites australis]